MMFLISGLVYFHHHDDDDRDDYERNERSPPTQTVNENIRDKKPLNSGNKKSINIIITIKMIIIIMIMI